MLNLFDILTYASTTQKDICSFELSLCSCIPILVYQLIVKFMSCIRVLRCVLFLWSVKPFYFIMNRRNKLQNLIYLGLGQSNCIPRIKMPIQLLFCSTSEYYPLYVRIVMRIAPFLLNSWHSDTSCHHFSFLGPRFVATGMPTSELWCVNSILLATPLLGS